MLGREKEASARRAERGDVREAASASPRAAAVWAARFGVFSLTHLAPSRVLAVRGGNKRASPAWPLPESPSPGAAGPALTMQETDARSVSEAALCVTYGERQLQRLRLPESCGRRRQVHTAAPAPAKLTQ